MSRAIKVLIVEDNEDDALLAVRQLVQDGYNVSYERVDTQEAMKSSLEQAEWDVVLSDYAMPHFSGEAALGLVRNTYPDMPFIVVSGTIGEDVAVDMMRAGANDYLLKDRIARLVPAVERILAEAQMRRKQKQAETALQRIQWLLTKRPKGHIVEAKSDYEPPYGDLTELNTCRVILDSVGKEMLCEITDDYLDLLGTSGAIYEENGDYALGVFSSGWCRLLDVASHDLCGTEDNAQALKCGKWLCHESCWTKVSKAVIETGGPVDIECNGGIRLYAVPIYAGEKIVGAINFGYGDPPKDSGKLQELALRYGVEVDRLRSQAEAYESRPPFIIDIAKDRLQTSARLIGAIVECRMAEKSLQKHQQQLRSLASELSKSEEGTRRKIAVELHDNIGHDLTLTKMKAETLCEKLTSTEFFDNINEIVDSLVKSIKDVGSFTFELSPAILYESGLDAAIEWLADRFERQLGITCRFNGDGESQSLPGDFQVLLFRCLRELLMNVRKHAHAKAVSIAAAKDSTCYKVTIEDDGIGFESSSVGMLSNNSTSGGFGLFSIIERLNYQGGSVEIDSQPGKGTRITLTVPLAANTLK